MENKSIIVRIVFWGKPKGLPKWPNIYFNPEERISLIKNFLLKRFPEIRFVGWDWVKSEDEIDRIVEKVGVENEIATVIFHLSSGWHGAEKIMKKIPTIVISDPLLWGYAGMITHSHNLRKNGVRGFIVSSSDWNDVEKAFKVIKAYHSIKNSTILVIGDKTLEKNIEKYRKLGFKVILIGFEELKEEMKNIDENNVKKMLEKISLNAEKIVGINREELIKSIKAYYALKILAEKYNANGVTIDCLGGFYSRKIDVYPCIAFSLLDDEGKIMSACETDINSLLTKIAMKEIADRPGFLSEPAIDTSTNLAIYAHCVSATRLYGFKEKNEPYILKTHAEDDRGVSVQVLSRYFGPGTIVKIVPDENKILVLRGRIRGHVERELACRTKIVVEIKDGQSLIDNWQHSWHRVLYYGDWFKEIKWLSKLLGYRLVIEDGSF